MLRIRWELLMFVVILLSLASSKRVRKSFQMSSWTPPNHFVFLTKMHIDFGDCQIQLSHTKHIKDHPYHLYDRMSIGIVSEKNIQEFLNEPDCSKKALLFTKKQLLRLGSETYSIKHMRLMQIQSQQLFYFYLYACDIPATPAESQLLSSSQINFTLTLLNNGSHFGANQQYIIGYTILVAIWIAILLKFSTPIGKILQERRPQMNRVLIYMGMVVLGIAYMYRLLHLALYYTDGEGIFLFKEFYTILKHFGEAINTTTLLAIACGWSIMYSEISTSTVIVGTLTTICNVICIIIITFIDEREDTFHIYDYTPGRIVLILRVTMAIAFSIAIIRTSNQMTSWRHRNFLHKLCLVGLIYLLSWPTTVFLVQMILPPYMHQQIITFVQQLVHLLACTKLCSMITKPDSQYRSVSILVDDNPFKMRDYKHK